MKKEAYNEAKIEIPEQVQVSASELVQDAFRLVSEQAKKLSEELSMFEKEDELTRRRIQRSVRRTSGRIV